MNKKLALLLIPLMLMPLMAYGYAHFTDEVQKKYKIHVGSVFLNVTGFHLDYAKMPDVDNDGDIWGDELNVTIYEADDCRWYVLIEADPITGGFILNTTLWMHNGGKLPFELRWEVKWDNATGHTDPCWDTIPTQNMATLPMPPWSWRMDVYRWHLNPATGEYERTGPFDPTQVHYKPCDYIEVKQHVNFEQPDPADPASVDWQKDWQCKWIYIWITFTAQDVSEEMLGSETWGTPGTP